MKSSRRAATALAVLVAAVMLLFGSGAPGLSEIAHAILPTPTPTPTPRPRPTIPNLFGTPTPTPSPTPEEEEEEEGEEEEKAEESEDKKKKRKDGDRKRRGKDGRRRGRGPGRGKRGPVDGVFPLPPRIPGAYNTDRLVAIAAQLRAVGWTERAVVERVFPPFIIGGHASWVDTWGAPRFGPGPIVRTHEGQDVFCTYGDPVLAAVPGTVEFAEGGLGGLVARLHTADGSYLYYAHLSGWNTQELASGDPVEPGDVIGYCGTSGNAATTPPHVHFGWYSAGGLVARNPMRILIRWLRDAEMRAQMLVEEVTGARVRNIDRLRLARRFGDSFAPDRSEFEVPGESLWAAGSTPATGAFMVARGALQEALTATLGPGLGSVLPSTTDEVPEVQPAVSMSPALVEVLSAAWPWRYELAD